jgi:ElaB/YqjD/DUF883 family membrane-anchored ribosome-binding protein
MMTANIDTAKAAVTGRLTPALESLDENVREARRALTHGRHAAEDLAAATVLQVRRHPLTAIALAGTVGAMAGCLMGFVFGWGVRRRMPAA